MTKPETTTASEPINAPAAESAPTPEVSHGVAVLRVRDRSTGHSYTIAAALYDPAKHVLTKSPAVDVYGTPLEPKFATAKGAQR